MQFYWEIARELYSVYFKIRMLTDVMEISAPRVSNTFDSLQSGAMKANAKLCLTLTSLNC